MKGSEEPQGWHQRVTLPPLRPKDCIRTGLAGLLVEESSQFVVTPLGGTLESKFPDLIPRPLPSPPFPTMVNPTGSLRT